ncbi:phosphotransferase family protein [Streptomyces sp. 6N223]|uniref:phosphotransferase family protein n=1 Tax=Streptomyces sp. 6N223 TaxID=3457412 RepID=UPI003FD41027
MTKRQLDHAALDRILADAGVPPAPGRAYEELPGGTYNTLYRVTPGGLLLKVPPDPATPAMSYEKELLAGEAIFYRLAAKEAGVPVPEVVYADPGGDYLLMTECPGAPWHEAPPAEADRPRLRRELGRLTALLNAVTGPHFGYPAAPAPPEQGWRGAFTAILDAVLADADRYAATLPVPLDRVRALADAAAPALDEVTAPALVHFDLWQGNILLSGGRISALIDGERMFWGDPLAEFASLNLLGGPEDDPDLLAGYADGGGTTAFDDAARVRLALYRAYLDLIMLIEVHPRAYGPERIAWSHREVAPHLVSALDEIAALT